MIVAFKLVQYDESGSDDDSSSDISEDVGLHPSLKRSLEELKKDDKNSSKNNDDLSEPSSKRRKLNDPNELKEETDSESEEYDTNQTDDPKIST